MHSILANFMFLKKNALQYNIKKTVSWNFPFQESHMLTDTTMNSDRRVPDA